MTVRRFLPILILLLAIGLAACAAPAATPPATTGDTGGTTGNSSGVVTSGLIGTWNTTSINGDTVNAQVFPTLIFNEAGEVAGNGGCNGYGGTYKADSSALQIEGVVSTMMACEDQALMNQETTFFASIQNSASYTLEGNTLTLLDADGNTLVTLTRA